MTRRTVEPLLVPAGMEEPWPDGTLVVYSYSSDKETRLAWVTAGAKRGDSGEFSYVKNLVQEAHGGGFIGGGSGAYVKASDNIGFRLPTTAEEILLARAYLADWTVQQAKRDLVDAEADLAAIQRVRAMVVS